MAVVRVTYKNKALACLRTKWHKPS